MITLDTLNPYEQIWQSRDLKALESTPIKLNNKRPEWKKGLNAFVDEMQGTGYGLAALASQGVENVVGPNDITKGITDWGLEGYNRNMEESQAGVNAPKIARVEDVHTASDAMDWASFQLGKGLPMLASLAVPAAIGGTIARFGAKEGVAALAKSAVGDTVKKAVATKALQAAEGDVVTGAMKQAAAKALQDRIAAGAVTGGYLGSFGLEGGQSFGETVAQGVKPEDAVKSAIAVGGINGALEFLPFYSAAKSIGLGQYAKKGIMDIIKSDAGLAKKAVQLAGELGGRAVKGGIVGAGAEGITEGLQELTSIAGERWAKNDPLFADLSEDDWSRIKNASAAGALTGATAMGAGAVLKGPQKAGTSTDEGQQGGSSAGGATARPKTREQEMEELRNKINTELEAAVKSGNTARAEQLAGARDKLDMELGREAVPPVQQPTAQEAPMQELPVQGPIIQEAPAQEVTPPSSQKENLTESLGNAGTAIRENLREAWRKSVEATGKVPSAESNSNLGQLYENLITKRGFPRNVDTLNSVIDFLENNTNKSLNDPDVRAAMDKQFTPAKPAEVSNAEAPTQEPPARKVIPSRPGESIQMQRGEEIILTPSDPETRVVPTEEEKVRLQELMGARPEKAPVQDVTQPEVVPNAQEVQAQTKTPVKGTPPLYSKPIGEIKTPSKSVSTEAAMEEFEAVRRQFQERQSQTPFKKWFGTGTPNITATKEGEPITLYHGTNNPAFYEWDSTKAGEASGHPTSGLGFFMTADQGAAARYGNKLLELHTKINNPYTLTDADLTRIETPQDAMQLRKKLMSKGYDGAVVTAPGASPYVIAFQANQIKLKSNTTPTDSPDMRYSKPLQGRKASAPFYSALERAMQEIKQQKAPANQWLGTLDMMVKKGIIRQEELDWSGTKEWLQDQKGQVTKEELLQHVKDNTLEVQETEFKTYTKEDLENDPNYIIESFDSFGEPKWSVRPANTIDVYEDAFVVSRDRNDVISRAVEFLNSTKYPINTKWTLPGGENQRELVLTVPSIEPFNTDDTTHYGDVGGGRAVAWVRFNDRVDADGKKTLFIEEVQSKRHQEGKDKGYNNKEGIEKLEQLKESVDQRMEALGIEPGGWIAEEEFARMPEDLRKDWKAVYESMDFGDNLVPDAPFKQTIAGSGQTLSGWVGLAFKRMLKYAVENGYDKVAWTTGEQQAKRYNLSKQVKILEYNPGFKQLTVYGKNNETILNQTASEENIKNYIGSELAKKLLSQKEDNSVKRLEGTNLEIGGEGMKGFYDRLLPNEINKYVKKWGAKVDKTEMEFGDENAAVHSVEITPAMRDSVMQGQPLFSRAKEKIVTSEMDVEYLAAVERGDIKTAQKIVDEAAKKAGYTVGPVYHGGSFNQNIDPVFNVPEGPVRKNKWQLAFGVHFAETQPEANVYLKKNGALQSSYLDSNMFDGISNTILSEKDLSRWPDSVRKRIDKLNKQWKNENTYAFQVTQALDSMAPAQASQAVINAGYTGIKYEARANIDNKSYRPFTAYLVVGDSSQIKSADLVTYDNVGNIIPLSQRFNKATPDIRYTQQPGTTTVPLQDLQSNIDSIMGQGWLQQAQELGLVEVIEGAGPNGEAGSWAGDRIRLYTDTMPKNGSPAGVLLHEGKHVTFEDVLGNSLPEYVKDLHTLASNGNKVAQDAITHAAIAVADVLGIKHNLLEGGTKADLKNLRALIEQERPGLLAEEELAYFVQYGADAQTGTGFWRRLVNQIKAWFAQTKLGQRMKELGIGFELTDAMAVEWAKMGLQRSLENAQQAAQVKEQVVNEAKLMPPSVRLGRALAALDGQYSFADEAAIQNIPEASLNAVRASYENTDQWMKAPNGKPTKLNERQWLQVRTPAFKNWFGDWENDSITASKVIDENGEPLVVYHGTTSDFNKFDASYYNKQDHGWYGVGHYLTADPETASAYSTWNEKNGEAPDANVIPVFVSVKNPYTWNNNKATAMNTTEAKSLTEDLISQGYDGVIVPNEYQSGTDLINFHEINAFQPTQIKSAISNTGAFSLTDSNILYSMSIREITQQLWNDPTDIRPEIVNKPGILQKWRADFIDFFAEIEKKSKTVYDAFTLLRNKKAARLAQARQEYYLPLLKEIVGSKWTAQQVGDMLAARHHKVDKVNTRLAERASYGYTKELLKALNKTKRKELMEGRVHIKAGKMPDGKVYTINGVPATMSAVTKQKLMFDLMNKYSQFEIANADGKQALREEWEIFKDAAGGFSDGGVAKGMVRTVDEVLAPASEDQARFDRIMALFDAMNRHALQIREDGGLITADEHARLLMDKSAYAPLKRESYNVNTETMRLFQQAGRGGSKNLGTRAGTAELSEPTNVLQNALALLEASAAAAERNLANQELYKVVNADKAAWKPWFHIAAKDEYVTHDEDGFLREKNSTAVNRADIVLIKDGRKIVIRPNMHNERAMGFVRAANNLDAQELSGPMKVLGMFNNLVRAVNITFSPIFLMMNAIKDPLTAAYNLQATEGAKHTKEIFVKDYFKTYRNSFRMLKKVFMDGNRDRTDADVKWVERYENAGGRTSFIEQLKENDNTWRSFDAQVARRQGNFKHLMAVKDTWIDGIENLNILFENVMRFSTFRVLVEKGMSDTDAARIAQDLTTNFSRRGYKSQALGLWWLFFNASVQGNYQVVRNLMKSKRLQVLSLGTIAFAVMLDLLGRAIADDWDEIPEWDKERFIIIPVKVGGDYVKIPAPWVYNTLWRTGGLIGEMFSGVKEPQDALLDMAAMTATTFNPLGKPGSIAQAIAPTAADPFIQILENKDFAGNPIGPEGYPGASKKANSELLWSSTPKGYQSIARFVNEVTGGSATESGGIDLKPGDYQLLAKFLTGSMGRFLTDSTFGFAEDVKKGIEGPKDIPVIREFFSDPYDPLTVQKYHTNIASIYGAHRLERMYREGPDRDLIKLQEVRSERGEELRMYSQAQDVERQLKSLRVRLKAAQARDDVGREKQLKERMAQVQEQFNAAYRQRVN